MKTFHIAYYINIDQKVLTGVTIVANDMATALNRFINDNNAPNDHIKYIMEI